MNYSDDYQTNELKICGLCLDKKDVLIQLNCLHNICDECVDYVIKNSNREFKCKVTNKDLVSCGITTYFKKDYTLNYNLYAMNQEKIKDYNNNYYYKSTKTECEECEMKPTNVCHTCSVEYCGLHAKSHKISKYGKNHNIVEIKDEDLIFACPKHENEKLVFYCNTCSILTCSRCAIIDHLCHNLISYNEFNNLSCFMKEEYDKFIGMYKDIIKCIEEHSNNNAISLAEFDIAITESFDNFKLKLDKIKANMIECYKTKYAGPIDKRIESDLNGLLINCSDFIDDADKIINTNNCSLIINSNKQIKATSKEYSGHFSKINDEINKDNVVKNILLNKIITELTNNWKIIEKSLQPDKDKVANFISEMYKDSNNQKIDIINQISDKDIINKKKTSNKKFSIIKPKGSFGKHGIKKEELNQPFDTFVDKNNIYVVTDTNNHRIQFFTNKGKNIKQIGGKRGKANGEFDQPIGLTITNEGFIIVNEFSNNRIQVFDQDGNFKNKFGSKGKKENQFNIGVGKLTTNKNDQIFISDCNNNRVCIHSFNGEFIKTIPNIHLPTGIRFDSEGFLFVSNMKTKSIIKYDDEYNIVKNNNFKDNFETCNSIPIAFDSYDRLLVTTDVGKKLHYFNHNDGDSIDIFQEHQLPDSCIPKGIYMDLDQNAIIADWKSSSVLIYEFIE